MTNSPLESMSPASTNPSTGPVDGFMPTTMEEDDDLPF